MTRSTREIITHLKVAAIALDAAIHAAHDATDAMKELRAIDEAIGDLRDSLEEEDL